MFTFPNVNKPFKNLIDRNDDGFIGQIIGENASVFINNAIARLQPKRVILAGMSDIQKSYIYAHLPKKMLIEIDSEAQVNGSNTVEVCIRRR